MVRVPSVGLSPISRPQFQAPGVVAFQGTGESQQAARDAQRLGQVGNFLSAVGREAEDKVNNARAREFANTFENGVNKALFTYEQTKGKDGVTGLEAFNKEIEEIYQGASGMLMNDTQRQAAAPIVDKIRNRASLRSQAHYAKAAAEDEQAQNLATQALLRDQMIAAPESPESLGYFGRFNELVRLEADALGLEGNARTVFELSKRDKLFQDVVTQGLDSQDPQKIAAIKNLIENVPDGVMSQSKKLALLNKVLDKSDEDIDQQDIVEFYELGFTLQEVYAQSDALLRAGVYTSAQWKKYRSQAASYYRQQREAQGMAEADLLDEVQSLKDQGQPIPSQLESLASQLGIKSNFDKIIAGSDDWSSDGRALWADYQLNPAKALADYQSDPKDFIERLNAVMPWTSVQQILRDIRALDSSQSTGRGSRSGRSASSSANLITERELANGLLQEYAYGHGHKHGLSVYKNNKNLSDYQKANIELRWREALLPLVEVEIAKGSSPEEAVRKVAPKLWASGQYISPQDNKPRNRWSEAAYHISGYAANLENEIDNDGRYGDKGRSLVDIARERLQQQRVDEALQRRMMRDRQRFVPPTSALLGMPESQAMRSDEEIRQQVMGEMAANQEMFGVALPFDDTPLYVSQQDIYDEVEKMIQEGKDKAAAATPEGRNNRELLAISRLDRIMSQPQQAAAAASAGVDAMSGIAGMFGTGNIARQAFRSTINQAANMTPYAQAMERIGDRGDVFELEAIGNHVVNFFNWTFSSDEDPYVPLPGMAPDNFGRALKISKTITVLENGSPVNAYDNFIQNGGTNEEWEEIVGHHSISDRALEPKPKDMSGDPAGIQRFQGRANSGGRGGTTYKERQNAYNQLRSSDKTSLMRNTGYVEPRDELRGRINYLRYQQGKLSRIGTRIRNSIQRYQNQRGYEEYVNAQKKQRESIMNKIADLLARRQSVQADLEAMEEMSRWEDREKLWYSKYGKAENAGGQ